MVYLMPLRTYEIQNVAYCIEEGDCKVVTVFHPCRVWRRITGFLFVMIKNWFCMQEILSSISVLTEGMGLQLQNVSFINGTGVFTAL